MAPLPAAAILLPADGTALALRADSTARCPFWRGDNIPIPSDGRRSWPPGSSCTY